MPHGRPPGAGCKDGKHKRPPGLLRAAFFLGSRGEQAIGRGGRRRAGADRVLIFVEMAASTAKDVETLLDEQPISIPALDIIVDEMELRGRRLGRVEIEAVNRGASSQDAVAREWRLNKFNILTPEATLTATGNWASLPLPTVGPRQPGERRRTVMNVRFDIRDAGQLLTRLGMPGVVRGLDAGLISLFLNWEMWALIVARFAQLVVGLFLEAEAARGVLAIGHDEVQRPLAADAGQALHDGLIPGGAHDVPDEQDVEQAVITRHGGPF